MSADIQRFPKDSPRQRRPAHYPSSADGGADRTLGKVFGFVERWATRSRIDDKLRRLEVLSPGAFRSIAPQIETIVDEALATLPESDQDPNRRVARTRRMMRLTWALIALAITLGLIIFGQQLATVFRPR